MDQDRREEELDDYTSYPCFCGHEFEQHHDDPDDYSQRFCRVEGCPCIEFDNNVGREG